MGKTLAEEAGELTRKAMDNGGTGTLNNGFEVESLIPKIIEGIKTEAEKGRTSYRVYLPRHPAEEPRDPLKITKDNLGNFFADCYQAKTDEEKVINKWRMELLEFGIKNGFFVIISPTQVCDSCEGFPGISSDCKACKGRKLKNPTLDDERKFSKYHYLEFRWLPAKKEK